MFGGGLLSGKKRVASADGVPDPGGWCGGGSGSGGVIVGALLNGSVV